MTFRILPPDIYLRRIGTTKDALVLSPDPDRAREDAFVGYVGGQLMIYLRSEWEECEMPEYEKRWKNIE